MARRSGNITAMGGCIHGNSTRGGKWENFGVWRVRTKMARAADDYKHRKRISRAQSSIFSVFMYGGKSCAQKPDLVGLMSEGMPATPATKRLGRT